MKLHKIFILLALVHTLPTFGAAAFVKSIFQKKKPKVVSAQVAAVENDPISAQFYELVKNDDPSAQSFFEQNKAQINVNYENKNGYRVLHFAARNLNVLLTQSLLNHNADPNLTNHWQENALIAAYGNYPTLQSCDKTIKLTNLLIAAGTPINQQNTITTTALMCAIGHGYSFILPILLRHGADITIQAKDRKFNNHTFIPVDTPFKDALNIAHAYKQHAQTPEQWTIGHHMVKTLEKHKKRTQHLDPLRNYLPLDLILIVGKYDRG